MQAKAALENLRPTEDHTAQSSDHDEVAIFLGDSPTAAVFTTKDNQLRWRYKENNGKLPFEFVGAISEFDGLMTRISLCVPKAYRKEAYFQLGKSLFAALNSSDGHKTAAYFRQIRIFVRTKAKERARFVYVIASMVSSLLLALLMIPVYTKTKVAHGDVAIILLGGWFGTIGASISVLQRNPSLHIDPWMGIGSISFQGIARIVLGFVFGCIFVMASKANLVFGVIGNNIYTLLLLSVVAGLSERFIPELLSKWETPKMTDSG